MDRSTRLHVIGKITYYLGWISLISGGLLHVNLAKGIFLALNLTQRNLLEIGAVCFMICVASEVRAVTATEKEIPVIVKRPAAA